MNYKAKLDEIISSKNVVENFHSEYENNEQFRTWLLSLIPEIRDCELQQQNNPWHKYNVLDHILHSVEEMNKQTTSLPEKDRLMLSYVMLMHDIGKPECHLTRMKNGQQIDSFFNHNKASAKIADRVLPSLGFSQKETSVISKLVYKHDIFMFIEIDNTKNPYHKKLTDGLIESEIKDLNTVGDGEKLMRYLTMVGRSDSRAQNEKMTAESLKLLSKFDEMLDLRNQMSK